MNFRKLCLVIGEYSMEASNDYFVSVFVNIQETAKAVMSF